MTAIPDDEIMGHRSIAGVALLMADYLSSPQVRSLVHYLLQAGESADPEAFVRELAPRVPQHGDALMTIAQHEQKGIQRGEQRGIEKGCNEGEREATLKIARTMLQSGLDRRPPDLKKPPLSSD